MNFSLTCAAGFIGSNFVLHMLAEHSTDSFAVLDNPTYTRNAENPTEQEDYPASQFILDATGDHVPCKRRYDWTLA